MKRIPKGWVYRKYPNPFEAIIEGPNYEVFRAAQFDSQPSLVEVLYTHFLKSIYGLNNNYVLSRERDDLCRYRGCRWVRLPPSMALRATIGSSRTDCNLRDSRRANIGNFLWE